MLRFDMDKVIAADPATVVCNCSDLLSLAYCGLNTAVFRAGDLEDSGIDASCVSMGAMAVIASCAEALWALVNEDRIKGVDDGQGQE